MPYFHAVSQNTGSFMQSITLPDHFPARFAAAALAIFIPVNLSFSTVGQFFGSDAILLLMAWQQCTLWLAPLISVALYFLWKRVERSRPGAGDTFYAVCVAMVRYWLAISLAEYGMSKIMHWQFNMGSYLQDVPLRDLRPMQLTWYYFGFSYTYACIVGCIQLLGSLLLLFRRTFLLAAMMLLPVLANIVMIDIFFQVAPMALLNAIAYTTGLLFLILLHWKPLHAVFLQAGMALPHRIPRWFKYSSILLGIGALAWIFATKGPESDHGLAGKWNVDSILIGGHRPGEEEWLHNQLAWKYVYFNSHATDVWLNPNPFILVQDRALHGYCHYQRDTISTFLSYADHVGWGPATIVQHAAKPGFQHWTVYTRGLVAKEVKVEVWLSKTAE